MAVLQSRARRLRQINRCLWSCFWALYLFLYLFLLLDCAFPGVPYRVVSSILYPVSCNHIVKVATGGSLTCVICSKDSTMSPPTENKLLCWGDNHGLKVGVGVLAGIKITTPTTVPKIKYPIDIALGGKHSCAITFSSNNLYCWGRNYYGQLGVPCTGTTHSDKMACNELPTIVSVDGAPITGVKKVAVGGMQYTCIISEFNEVLCWGFDGHHIPQKIAIGEKEMEHAVEISLGFRHACVITNLQILRCWKGHQFGQLADGSQVPSRFNLFLDSKKEKKSQYPVKVNANGDYTYVITSEDNLLYWNMEDSRDYGAVSFPSLLESHPIEVSTSYYNTCAVIADESQQERIYCWDSKDDKKSRRYYKNDDDHDDEKLYVRMIPDSKTIFGPQSTHMTVSSSSLEHVCATLDDGKSLFCWGDNYSGQLGDGTLIDKHNPTQVVF